MAQLAQPGAEDGDRAAPAVVVGDGHRPCRGGPAPGDGHGVGDRAEEDGQALTRSSTTMVGVVGAGGPMLMFTGLPLARVTVPAVTWGLRRDVPDPDVGDAETRYV